LIAAIVLVCATMSIFSVSTKSYQTGEIARLDQQAALYGTTLADTLERFAHFPLLLSQIPIIEAAPTDAPLVTSDWLARMADEMDVEAIYVMDRSGLTVAASNHRQAAPFLGQNYGFRPYFQAAMRGMRGEFFAIGATTSRPGYFFAAPIGSEGAISGAVAVKLDLSPLVERWRTGGEQVMVTIAAAEFNPAHRNDPLIPVALFLAILGALALAWVFVRTSRMRVALAASREEEAKLNALNLRLRDEVVERQAAESALRAARRRRIQPGAQERSADPAD